MYELPENIVKIAAKVVNQRTKPVVRDMIRRHAIAAAEVALQVDKRNRQRGQMVAIVLGPHDFRGGPLCPTKDPVWHRLSSSPEYAKSWEQKIIVLAAYLVASGRKPRLRLTHGLFHEPENWQPYTWHPEAKARVCWEYEVADAAGIFREGYFDRVVDWDIEHLRHIARWKKDIDDLQQAVRRNDLRSTNDGIVKTLELRMRDGQDRPSHAEVARQFGVTKGRRTREILKDPRLAGWVSRNNSKSPGVMTDADQMRVLENRFISELSVNDQASARERFYRLSHSERAELIDCDDSETLL